VLIATPRSTKLDNTRPHRRRSTTRTQDFRDRSVRRTWSLWSPWQRRRWCRRLSTDNGDDRQSADVGVESRCQRSRVDRLVDVQLSQELTAGRLSGRRRSCLVSGDDRQFPIGVDEDDVYIIRREVGWAEVNCQLQQLEVVCKFTGGEEKQFGLCCQTEALLLN